MTNKISSSLIKKIEKVVDLDKVCEVCYCYAFGNKKIYNAVAQRYHDMRSKIIRLCRRQQNKIK